MVPRRLSQRRRACQARNNSAEHPIGGIEQALDRHGDEIMSSLGASAAKTVEKLFRSLTVMQGGVALRRPQKLGHLYQIAGADAPESRQQVDVIIRAFADRQNSFLMLSTRELTSDTVVDITHESVIRKWRQLKNWVREESRSAEWYAIAAGGGAHRDSFIEEIVCRRGRI